MYSPTHKSISETIISTVVFESVVIHHRRIHRMRTGACSVPVPYSRRHKGGSRKAYTRTIPDDILPSRYTVDLLCPRVLPDNDGTSRGDGGSGCAAADASQGCIDPAGGVRGGKPSCRLPALLCLGRARFEMSAALPSLLSPLHETHEHKMVEWFAPRSQCRYRLFHALTASP